MKSELSSTDYELIIYFEKHPICDYENKLFVNITSVYNINNNSQKDNEISYNTFICEDNITYYEKNCMPFTPETKLPILQGKVCGIIARRPCVTKDFDNWYVNVDVKDDDLNLIYTSRLEINCSYQSDEGISSFDGILRDHQFRIKYRYLCIYPLDIGFDSPDLSSYSFITSPGPEPLIVGHRGVGATPSIFTADGSPRLKLEETFPENTVVAFTKAADLGIPMVEMDVHWTKDQQAVIYHDFVMMDGENLIKDLTLSEVRARGEALLSSGSLFPLLSEVLKQVPNSLAFNLEFKYPVLQADKKWSTGIIADTPEEYYMTKNLFIDYILKEISLYVGRRPLVLSCFNPDVCLMLSRKQSRYPVLSITRGSSGHPGIEHVDPRLSDLERGIVWTRMMSLQGIVTVFNQWEIHPELALQCRSLGLMTMAYGADTYTKRFYNFAKAYSISGVAVDLTQPHKEETLDCIKL